MNIRELACALILCLLNAICVPGCAQAVRPPSYDRDDLVVESSGTIDFMVTDRWGCHRVIFTAGWDNKLQHIMIEEQRGEAFMLYPNRVEAQGNSTPIADKQFNWTIWEKRYIEFRKMTVGPPKTCK